MRLGMSISEARELATSLRERRHHIDLEEARWAADAARLADSGYHELEGFFRPSDFLRHHCRMGEGAVRDRLSVGRRLGDMPESQAALIDGEIGFGHLVVMAQTANSQPTGAFDELALLEKAKEETVNRFWHTSQNYLHACDAEQFADRAEALFEQRELTIRRRRDGAFTFWGRLDPAGAAVVKAALAPLAKRCGKEDNRSFKQRLHDALVEHASHNQTTQLNVTVGMETVLALAGAPAAEVEGLPPIAQRTVERLLCGCAIRRIVLDSKSNVIEVGRSRRVTSASGRRALQARQKGLCGFSGCDRPGKIPHHIKFWSQGGTSDLDNQVLVCYFHHRLLHEGGWRMARDDDGQILVLRPPPSFNFARGPDDLAASA